MAIKNIFITEQQLTTAISGVNSDVTAVSGQVQTLNTTIDTLLNTSGATEVIDTFKDVEEFLAGVTDKQTLTSLLQEQANNLEDYADGAAAVAKSAAIETAATDATTKADAAKSAAIETAATDATTKANAAKAAAIETAATDATTKANAAQAAAEATAAADATTKADAAKDDAIAASKEYANGLVQDAEGNPKFDAAGAASTAEQNAKDYADSAIEKLNIGDYATISAMNAADEAVLDDAKDYVDEQKFVEYTSADESESAYTFVNKTFGIYNVDPTTFNEEGVEVPETIQVASMTLEGFSVGTIDTTTGDTKLATIIKESTMKFTKEGVDAQFGLSYEFNNNMVSTANKDLLFLFDNGEDSDNATYILRNKTEFEEGESHLKYIATEDYVDSITIKNALTYTPDAENPSVTPLNREDLVVGDYTDLQKDFEEIATGKSMTIISKDTISIAKKVSDSAMATTFLSESGVFPSIGVQMQVVDGDDSIEQTVAMMPYASGGALITKSGSSQSDYALYADGKSGYIARMKYQMPSETFELPYVEDYVEAEITKLGIADYLKTADVTTAIETVSATKPLNAFYMKDADGKVWKLSLASGGILQTEEVEEATE